RDRVVQGGFAPRLPGGYRFAQRAKIRGERHLDPLLAIGKRGDRELVAGRRLIEEELRRALAPAQPLSRVHAAREVLEQDEARGSVGPALEAVESGGTAVHAELEVFPVEPLDVARAVAHHDRHQHVTDRNAVGKLCARVVLGRAARSGLARARSREGYEEAPRGEQEGKSAEGSEVRHTDDHGSKPCAIGYG